MKAYSVWVDVDDEEQPLPEPYLELIVWFNAIDLNHRPYVMKQYLHNADVANEDIQNYYTGEYVPVESDIKYPVGEEPEDYHESGIGWRKWYISEQKILDWAETPDFSLGCKYWLDWYNDWGDSACLSHDVTIGVSFQTIVFEWVTADGAQPPDVVHILSESGEKHDLKVGVEYLLMPDLLPKLEDALLAPCLPYDDSEYSVYIPSAAIGREHDETESEETNLFFRYEGYSYNEE